MYLESECFCFASILLARDDDAIRSRYIAEVFFCDSEEIIDRDHEERCSLLIANIRSNLEESVIVVSCRFCIFGEWRIELRKYAELRLIESLLFVGILEEPVDRLRKVLECSSDAWITVGIELECMGS